MNSIDFFCLKRTTSLLAFLLIHLAATAQTSYIHFGIDEGLPTHEIYDVTQDKSGFIWFATDNGVVRFDGNNMRIFQGREGLPDPVIFGFCDDSKARLWFRSYSGAMSWIENDTIHPYKWNDTLSSICSNGRLRTFRVDSLGNVYFSTDNSNGIISVNGRVTKKTSPVNSLDYWKSGEDHVVIWKGKTYASSKDILYEIRDGIPTRVHKAPSLIISLSTDSENTLWVGGLRSDCQRFSDSNFQSAGVPDFLKGEAVSRVFQDRQLGYWITTIKNGVYYIPRLGYQHILIHDFGKIQALAGSGSKIILGDEYGKVTLLNKKLLTTQGRVQLPNPGLATIVTDRNGNYWISDEKNVLLFDSTLMLRHSMSMSVRGFCYDGQQTMWTFNNNKVDKFDLNGKLLLSYPTHTIHRTLTLTKSGAVMAARTGLEVLDSAFRVIALPREFQNLKINRTLLLTDSTILVTTIGSGFFIVNTNNWSFKQYDERQHFVARNIYDAIVIDSMIWIATEKGIAIAATRALTNGSPAFSFITARNGLQSDRVDHLFHQNQLVYVVSGNGLSIVPVQSNAQWDQPPVFYLTSTRVNDQILSLNQNRMLATGDNNIRVDFGFIDFTGRTIFVRSRLSRAAPWNYSSGRSLYFDRLAPGSYHLELEYSADTFHWLQAKAGVHFSIAYPWWQRWYFQFLFFVVVGLIGFFVFRTRLNTFKERNKLLTVINEHRHNLLKAEIEAMEGERSRIAKDLHDGAGMNLTLVKLKIYQLFKKTPTEGSDQVMGSIDTAIGDIRDLIYDLTPSGIFRNGLAEVLESFIQRNLSGLDTKIKLHTTGAKITDKRISLSCFRILQELISNSLRHGNPAQITIHVNTFDDYISILYEDDGVGFVLEKIKKGAGLFNIESRLELIHGTMEFTSDENGVSYSVVIPLNEKYTDNDSNR